MRKEIGISQIENIMIGQTEDVVGGTGCTVFLSRHGMPAGIDVRGGGPASRESNLLNPLVSAQYIHGIVLSGGSAYGLDAAGGVMQELEEHGIGYDTGAALVPLVCQSCLYDLGVGDPHVRPDRIMGRRAAQIAFAGGNYRDGNYGAGCGATVGKIAGLDTCMKSGIGSYACQIDDLQVGVIVAVNAFGDVFDRDSGRKVAGLLTPDRQSFMDADEVFMHTTVPVANKFTGNTTLAVIITNALLNKNDLCRIASMAHDGFASAIRPVHTSADGDTVYAVSVGNLHADQDLIGTLAADNVRKAILRAVTAAEPAYGHPSASSFM